MSFVSGILSSVDSIRGIPGELGLRPSSVTIRVRTWSGSRPGEPSSTYTDVDTSILVGGQNPKVRHLTSNDVVASGGLYTDQDYKIGPITPEFIGGGVSKSTIDPETTTTAREIFYQIVGPGEPDGGSWYQRVSDETEHSLHSYIVVRKTAVVP